MQVNGQSAAQNNTSAAGMMGSTDGQMFMQLLMAQLKSQDPMAPTDANQFVSQLVDFNSLSELTQIRQLVGSIATAATDATE
jgi:flagellar basal-body rod modification protein FlgD